MLISIVIPVYNSERFLRPCLDSVLAQTFNDFELILVDDGSVDLSGKICDEYAKKDSRVRVFHKENGGVSSARNLGMDNARGQWATFVDSDDVLDRSFLENFKPDKLDKSALAFQQFSVKKGPGNFLKPGVYEDLILGNSANFADLNKLILFGEAVSKLYSLEIVRGANMRFDEKISLHEDHLFYWQYLSHIRKFSASERVGYFYRIDPTCLSLSSPRRIKDPGELLYAHDKLRGALSELMGTFNLSGANLGPVLHFLASIKVKALRSALVLGRDWSTISDMVCDIKSSGTLKDYKPRSMSGKFLKLILSAPSWFAAGVLRLSFAMGKALKNGGIS